MRGIALMIAAMMQMFDNPLKEETIFDISFEDWIKLDIKYMQERSFWVDWKIIFLTVKAVLCKQVE